MSRNIKEIGKELLGKSLNSFHLKIGLPQLEKNNEMQDGILDGILSQVDDAYIEKTEQSNVIHLEGSGDGVVVLDSIKGNTMVNLVENGNVAKVIGVSAGTPAKYKYYQELKNNTDYIMTLEFENIAIEDFPYLNISYNRGSLGNINIVKNNGRFVFKFNTSNRTPLTEVWIYFTASYTPTSTNPKVKNIMLFELPINTNENILSTNYVEGLQSSFEEKVNDEGKYEIEILSHKGRPNELKNSFKELQASPKEYMFISITDIAKKYLGKRLVVSGKVKSIGKNGDVRIYSLGKYSVGFSAIFNCNTSNYINFVCEGRFTYDSNGENGEACNLSFYGIYDSGIFPCAKDIKIEILDDNDNILATEWCPNYKDDEIHWKNHKNSNKIKLLINEPLRSVGNVKDRLCVKNGKLVTERNCGEVILDGSAMFSYHNSYTTDNHITFNKIYTDIYEPKYIHQYDTSTGICDKFIQRGWQSVYGSKVDEEGFCFSGDNRRNIHIKISKSKLTSQDSNGLKNWFTNNPTTIVYQLAEPYYEEVLNEYGEPILLEGYENGTIYIDSIIVPTTTVRYTPKMESFKTLNEVNDNNTMLTNDINDNIIPYLMDVDLMIMEKEMALPSQINIRKMEVLDMTSMQKRTQQMLERLIKGKTLTEQECKTRVTTYLNAGKITDEQAEELMLLIDEVYA